MTATIPMEFARTKTTRLAKQQQARNWQFEQYDVAAFDNSVLENKYLSYSVYQYQMTGGHRFVHGMLRFTKQMKYSSVHGLIGGGDYCHITVAYCPRLVRDRCISDDYEHVPVTFGSFSKKKKKTKAVALPNVPVATPSTPVTSSYKDYLESKGLRTSVKKSSSQSPSSKMFKTSSKIAMSPHAKKLVQLAEL